MIPVTALDDPRVAEYRSLADPASLRRAGLFVAEGRLVVRRLLSHPRLRTRSVLATPVAWRALVDATSSTENSLTPGGAVGFAGAPVYVIEQALMNTLTGFNMHRGCLAIGERPDARLLSAATLERVRRAVVLEGVNNPDNVGGIFRSAAAFGVDLVVLGPGCADPLYRKAIRTSMAATLQVPFVGAGSWPDAIEQLRSQGFRVIALTPASDAPPLAECAADGSRLAILVGAEGHGLSAGALAAADERVRIVTTDCVDSLNVTVAASIALHHFAASGDCPPRESQFLRPENRRLAE